MPIFLYSHPDTGEVKEIIQSVHDKHEYFENGVKFNRVFTVPTASIDNKWNEFSSKDFAEKTAKKKGTIGDLWEKSQELSLKREKLVGKDTIKEQFYKDYSKERNNHDHPDIKKQKMKKTLDKLGVSYT